MREIVSTCSCGRVLPYGRRVCLGSYVGYCTCGAKIVWYDLPVVYIGDYQREGRQLVHTFQIIYPMSCRWCGSIINGIESYCQGVPIYLLPERCEIGVKE